MHPRVNPAKNDAGGVHDQRDDGKGERRRRDRSFNVQTVQVHEYIKCNGDTVRGVRGWESVFQMMITDRYLRVNSKFSTIMYSLTQPRDRWHERPRRTDQILDKGGTVYAKCQNQQ
jgi:hypothetical protein